MLYQGCLTIINYFQTIMRGSRDRLYNYFCVRLKKETHFAQFVAVRNMEYMFRLSVILSLVFGYLCREGIRISGKRMVAASQMRNSQVSCLCSICLLYKKICFWYLVKFCFIVKKARKRFWSVIISVDWFQNLVGDI